MKKKINVILSLCMAFLVFIMPFSCCLNNVSASVSESDIWFNSSFPSSSRSSFTDFVNSVSSYFNGQYEHVLCYSVNNHYYYIPSEYLIQISNLYSNYNNGGSFRVPNEYNNGGSLSGNFSVGNTSSYIWVFDIAEHTYNYIVSSQFTNVTDFWNRYNHYALGAFCMVDVSSSFLPDDYEIVNPFFSLDVDDFYTWLVNNDKIQISGDSGGVSVGGKIPSYIGTQKLKSFLNFYKNYGASNKSFLRHIVEWFSYMNIVGQTKDNINILKSTTDYLYQEYINYRSGTHAYWPTAQKIQKRQNIDTITDDDNISLITDDNTDTLDISILRDILRGVIAISNNITQGVSDICSILNRLEFTVNVANEGGTGITDFSDLYIYDVDSFNNDLAEFEADIEAVQSIPMGYISDINQNVLMPENILEDKSSLTVNVPTLTGFAVGNNGNTYSIQTGTYVLSSADYPWLDTVVQKIKRFASIILIIGYLVHLRYRIPELVRGE